MATGVRSFFAWPGSAKWVSLHPSRSLAEARLLMSPRIAAALVPTLALALGCGGGANSADAGLSFAATPTQTVPSQSGALTVAVHAQAGHTPARGINAFRFVITDSHGAPVDHLQVTVLPFMPFMGHGSSVT